MIPTVSVTCESFDQNGNPIAGARFEAKLDRTEIYDGFVVPEKVTAIADTNGVCVLELWPNALGANASSYAIKAWNPDTGKRFIDTTAVVPNSDCRLEQIIVAEPYPALDAAQQALIAAQGALAPVTAQAQAAAASALVAQDAEDGALAAETAAQASAAAALASQQAAAISQTSALSSASTATGAAHTSTTAADAAVAARDVAQASATTATAQATAAGQSALAADASADAAAASQAAAAGSASTAQGHATAAAGSANTAQAEATAALQAKAAAQTAATSAQASAQQAEDAADTATGQAALAAAAVPTALGHANTAASHAATATTKAGEASASQTAAAASQAAAALSQSQASASASAAAVSASAAAVSAALASVSADNAISLFGSLVDVQAAADEAQAYATAAEVAVSNAQAQASLAAGYAASASSVVQQDLSGVNAAALHRSPNAVTVLFVYDTSKDSDGGAWTEKCQHTSWYNETINGRWLGAVAGANLAAAETAARAISGATTGDYFQARFDGKFYRLNATGGTTEVFRGNKRDFPRLAAIVAESTNVTIYDLTEPGRPMWMRFATNTSSTTMMAVVNVGNSLSAVACREGRLVVGSGGSSSGWIGTYIDFAAERVQYVANGTAASFFGNLAQRNLALGRVASGGFGTLTGLSANAVAMTVLPDAPVDPVTGLKVPTIAVATAGGVSVIKHNGTVVNSNSGATFTRVTLSPSLLSAAGATSTANWWFAANPGSLGASFIMTMLNTGEFARGNYGLLTSPARAEFLRSSGTLVTKRRNHETTGASSAHATITNTFNTGHMVGDIRRAYLSDVDAGSVTGPELVTNGTFDTDTTGWSRASGNATLSVVGGALRLTAIDTFTSYVVSQISVVAGRSYRFKALNTANSSSTAAIVIGSTAGGSDIYNSGGSTGFITVDTVFLAPVTGTVFIGLRSGNTVGGYSDYDNISAKEVVADRSYKAQNASITGTLTKTAVASAAQLVAYSGFSAANYLREPYSADLDFGTGEWTCSAWVSIPAANAAAGTLASRAHSSGASITLGIDATNKLTATAFDGTTTRTVTTSAAYNTATWLKARVNYRAGRLSILVNGVEVAVTNGAPLLTLNNSNAVLTIGNSFAADAPFPGSIALLKFSATVPTAEQSVWMYEQEKQMFREGAQVCLPDSGSIVDLTYDDATDKWIAVSAANESEWSGLVRTSVTPVPAGSYTRAAASSGVQLLARSTTSPGVDVTIPAYGLREELVKRAEAAARINQDVVVFDFDTIGFTAAMTNGSNQVTASSITGTPFVGMAITGTGIPAGTTITGINGTTYTLSANATATGSNAVGQAGFDLPVGYTARVVYSAGAQRREGSTRDYTRLFDGFREQVRFDVTPGASTWVQIHAVKEAA